MQEPAPLKGFTVMECIVWRGRRRYEVKKKINDLTAAAILTHAKYFCEKKRGRELKKNTK